ncbi:hypothetical protein [Acetobacter sp.]|jgi:hypothetical protein|uniref:hypothetical protein n=1 Tax=Acetobacter sp. TaxID=440 RepID=UPI0025C07083|nr:hypothetical protein [Acetobacter sp.]MCH4090742.1 hypothetical protein [Acetobacter sp.]MCI1300542.1 hypothetical protein [Acetobacter sp.]MCI1316256.1 hypothetical protein [Acetobacter sp.]
MYESHTVEIDGVFLGTIILDTNRTSHRFYATHDSVRALHNQILNERRELVRRAVSQFRGSARNGGSRVHRPV